MKFPKIDPDDLVLFGGVGLASFGVFLLTVASTDDLTLAFGAGLVLFGVVSALLTFLAAAEPSK